MKREDVQHVPLLGGEQLRKGHAPQLKGERGKSPGERRATSDRTLRVNVLFGPPTEWASDFAGVLSVTDARLLAFPVRSMKGVFAWVTCPTALNRLSRDVAMTGLPAVPIPEDLSIPDQHYAAAPACVCGFSRQGRNRAALEEFDFKEIEAKTDTTLLAGWIVSFLLSDKSEYRFSAAQFGSHFLVISDDEFTHFVRHSTEVSARIALNYDTKTVKTGALFYQEFLPAESLLYSLVLCNTARALRADATVTGEFLSDWSRTVNEAGLLQIGGDESTGKGLCAVRLTPAEKMEP